MERDLRVHLQQRRNQSHRHDHIASVPEEDQTPGEAGAHGVQVGVRLFFSNLVVLSARCRGYRGPEKAQLMEMDQELRSSDRLGYWNFPLCVT